VDLAELKVPEFQGRSWAELLGGKKPKVSFLARCVPADFYFAEFRSPAKLFEAFDTCDQWGKFLSIQGLQDTHALDARQRLLDQLSLQCLTPNMYGHCQATIAIVGSDLFLAEGSDVTALIHCANGNPLVWKDFQQWVKLPPERRGFIDSGGSIACALGLPPENAEPKSLGQLAGVDYFFHSLDGGKVQLYCANPRPNLHVRSNSVVALRRVLEAIQGKDADGKTVQTLGTSAEFRYARTQLPHDPEEDGFFYFSESFLKHLASPATFIKQRRRELAHAHLRMIGHAAQMYQSETGRLPESLGTLAAAQCVPGAFNEGELCSPGGGTYSLAADCRTGVSSVYGRADFLTPCCDLPLPQATAAEAEAYEAFAGTFDSNVCKLFTPVALRLRLTEKRLHVETFLAAPPGEEYGFAMKILGGEPEALDTLPVPKRNLFSLNFCLNKKAMCRELLTALEPEQAKKLATLHEQAAQITALRPDVPASVVAWAAWAAYDRHLDNSWSDLVCAKYDNPIIKAFAESAGFEPEHLEFLASLEKFVKQGIGNQVGFHVYDTAITFDVNHLAALAHLFSSNSEGDVSNYMSFAGIFCAGPLVAPAYMSIPVQDAAVVDEFLAKVDKLAPPLGAKTKTATFWNIEVDLYHFMVGDTKVRTCAVRYGSAKYRVYLGRVGDGLYISNSPVVFKDLQAAYPANALRAVAGCDRGPAAHMMVRLRPTHWDQALPGFRLGWAENNRAACIHNLGPLSSAARTLCGTNGNLSWDTRTQQVHDCAARVYGTTFCCPEGGRYELTKDGKSMTCSVHGSALEARQPLEPAADSVTGRLMGSLSDVTAAVTLTPAGPRLSLTIERR
jgi:hypothetical protein